MSTNKVSKRKILEAVENLINGYKENTLIHSTFSCPLCEVYYNSDVCGKCLNKVFAPLKTISCVTRIRKYDFLNWNDSNNKLIEYWKEICYYLNQVKLMRLLI